MPIEYRLLKNKCYKIKICPICHESNPLILRGEIQRSKRFLWILWKRDYCAIICHNCKNIIGWESP